MVRRSRVGGDIRRGNDSLCDLQAREEVKHLKETREQQDVPTLEADTTFDISDISTDTEVTAQLPEEDQPLDTQVCHETCTHLYTPVYHLLCLQIMCTVEKTYIGYEHPVYSNMWL